MAVRTDITVDFTVAPRIITVAAPSVVLTIQDLYDTLRDIEKKPRNMSQLILVSAGGKEALGGGVQVGITLTLQNAKVAFAARAGPSFVQCTVSGGNLVAVDAVQAIIDPVQTTAFTQVVIAQSSSATIASGDASAAAAAVMAEIVETQTSITFQQAMSIVLAAVAGETSGNGLTFKSSDGVATRIVAVVDTSNNRTSITLTPSS